MDTVASTDAQNARYTVAEKIMDAARRRGAKKPRSPRPGPVWGFIYNDRFSPILGRLLSRRVGAPAEVWIGRRDRKIIVAALIGEVGRRYHIEQTLTQAGLRDAGAKLLLGLTLGYMAQQYREAVA